MGLPGDSHKTRSRWVLSVTHGWNNKRGNRHMDFNSVSTLVHFIIKRCEK